MQKNIRNAAQACRAAAILGILPVAPHVFYSSFLDDKDEQDRELGMYLGIEELSACAVLLKLKFHGWEASEGMGREERFMQNIERPVVEVNVGDESFGAILAGMLKALEELEKLGYSVN
jgi:hypothetical protein